MHRRRMGKMIALEILGYLFMGWLGTIIAEWIDGWN